MEKANKYGKTVRDIMETGAITRPTVKAPSGTFMVISTMAAGLMIRLTVTGLTRMQTEPSIKAIGKMIFSMVTVSKSGPMALSTRATT